jgi:hypothetical protein
MIARFICLTLLLCHAARAGVVFDLKRVHSSEDLARYISSTATNHTALRVLLEGLDSTNSIQLAHYTAIIPVREICGTIIGEYFKDALGNGFYDPGKKYGVREICSFRDKDGEVWRYHITIFEEHQYRLLKDFLKRKINGVAEESQKH